MVGIICTTSETPPDQQKCRLSRRRYCTSGPLKLATHQLPLLGKDDEGGTSEEGCGHARERLS